METGDSEKSLIAEVETLREQVQRLCMAVRQLVQLQSVANLKLDAALKGGVGADCAVLSWVCKSKPTSRQRERRLGCRLSRIDEAISGFEIIN